VATIWTDLLHSDISYPEKLLRTLIVYAFLIVCLRLAGRRELSQLNSFDLVVLLLLSNTVQNAIIGADNSLVGGLFGAAVLLVVNWALIRTLYRHGRLDELEGKPELLIANGHLQRKNLEREMITTSEIEAAARRQGLASLAHVKECRLETGGALSFIERRPSTDDRRHHDLLQQIEVLQQSQRSLVTQLEALGRKIDGISKRS
jgi:uncharacterized membrane protein YcaP (DUF421 family)